MPNLKQEIVNRLKEFPGKIQPGQAFDEYLEDLAEDIQADVIKATITSPNRAALFIAPTLDAEAAAELEHQVDMLANGTVGAALNNLVFTFYHQQGNRVYYSRRKRLVRAMLLAMLAIEPQAVLPYNNTF